MPCGEAILEEPCGEPALGAVGALSEELDAGHETLDLGRCAGGSVEVSADRVLSASGGASLAMSAFQSASLLKSPLPRPNRVLGIGFVFGIAFTGITLLGGAAPTSGGADLNAVAS